MLPPSILVTFSPDVTVQFPKGGFIGEVSVKNSLKINTMHTIESNIANVFGAICNSIDQGFSHCLRVSLLFSMDLIHQTTCSSYDR